MALGVHGPLEAVGDVECVREARGLRRLPRRKRPRAGTADEVELRLRRRAGAMQVLGNDHFRYIGEWRGADGGVLEFTTELDGTTVNGVDIIRFTPDGQRIANFKVMVRPRRALEAVQAAMATMLAKMPQS